MPKKEELWSIQDFMAQELRQGNLESTMQMFRDGQRRSLVRK